MTTTTYCTAESVKATFRVTDSDDDLRLGLAIEAASRAIDDACNRRFYLDSATSARTYRTNYLCAPGEFFLKGNKWHDFDPATAPVVKSDDDGDGTFETTWVVGTDYLLEPLVYAETESEPQNTIRLLGSRYLRDSWTGRPQLQVTAKWGWPVVPRLIAQATAVLAVDFFRADNAPFGIGGASDFGVFRIKENGLVAGMISDYRLPKGIA